jgi:hypothetical protein
MGIFRTMIAAWGPQLLTLVLVTLAVACSPADQDGARGTAGNQADAGTGDGARGGGGQAGGTSGGSGLGGAGGSGGASAEMDAGAGDDRAAGSGGASEGDAATSSDDGSTRPDTDAGTATADGGSTSFDGGVATGNACPGYKKGTHTQTGVSVADFCTAYSKTCTFKPTNLFFKDEADCEATYQAGTDTTRTCRAGHLCEAVASTTANGRLINCQSAGHGTVCR